MEVAIGVWTAVVGLSKGKDVHQQNA
jgi:hypothetical protein